MSTPVMHRDDRTDAGRTRLGTRGVGQGRGLATEGFAQRLRAPWKRLRRSGALALPPVGHPPPIGTAHASNRINRDPDIHGCGSLGRDLLNIHVTPSANASCIVHN